VGCRSIRVAVDVTDAELSVTVENAASDGSGARLETAGGGFGLAGLRERMRTLRGTLEARPTPTGGWRLGTRLPLLGPKQHA
jgi:signal transduction histidine kinase